VDLVAVGREDVPLGTELVEALPLHVAGLLVAGVRVERVPGVGDLGLAVAALRRPELGGRDAGSGLRLAGRQRRPDAGAGGTAAAHGTLVLLEEVEGASAGVDEDSAELGLPRADRARRGLGRGRGGAVRRAG